MTKRAKGEPRAVDPILAGTLAMRVAVGDLTREQADRMLEESAKRRRTARKQSQKKIKK